MCDSFGHFNSMQDVEKVKHTEFNKSDIRIVFIFFSIQFTSVFDKWEVVDVYLSNWSFFTPPVFPLPY